MDDETELRLDVARRVGQAALDVRFQAAVKPDVHGEACQVISMLPEDSIARMMNVIADYGIGAYVALAGPGADDVLVLRLDIVYMSAEG